MQWGEVRRNFMMIFGKAAAGAVGTAIVFGYDNKFECLLVRNVSIDKIYGEIYLSYMREHISDCRETPWKAHVLNS